MKNHNTDLRTLIKRSGLTRQFIADRLNISYIFLHYLISGARKAEKTRKRLTNYLIEQISINSRKAA